MGQRIGKLLDHRLVDFGIFANGFEADGFAGFLCQFAGQPRHAREHRFDRLGADGHHRVLQAAGRLGQHFKAAYQFLVANAQCLIHLLGEHRLGNDQFANHVDDAVHLVEIDPDRLHAVAPLDLGLVDRHLGDARPWLRGHGLRADRNNRLRLGLRREALRQIGKTGHSVFGRVEPFQGVDRDGGHRHDVDRFRCGRLDHWGRPDNHRFAAQLGDAQIAIAFNEFEDLADTGFGRRGGNQRDFPAAIDPERLEIGEWRDVVKDHVDADLAERGEFPDQQQRIVGPGIEFAMRTEMNFPQPGVDGERWGREHVRVRQLRRQLFRLLFVDSVVAVELDHDWHEIDVEFLHRGAAIVVAAA